MIHLVLYAVFTLVFTLSITTLDIFRLGYILSHGMDIDPFLASVPILNSFKILGNQKASGVFSGYKMRSMAPNG